MGFVILLLILTLSVILNLVECGSLFVCFLFVCLFKFLSELLDQFLSCYILLDTNENLLLCFESFFRFRYELCLFARNHYFFYAM